MKPKKSILTQSQIRREILESHKRSKRYGVCREERSPDQKKLTPEALETQKSLNKDLLDVVSEYIDEFYELLSPDRFMIAIVDKEGFILQLSGSDSIKAEFAERNCAPGYRFTENDVGTTATSLCLKKQISIQLNDKDHFCMRAHGFTSSAAPIFGEHDVLQGVLAVSGKSSLVQPLTLITVTSAARSIEKQISLLRKNRELSIYAGFLANVLESAETGLLALDNELRIWKTNRKAKRLLKQENLDGKPISILTGLDVDLDDIYNNPDSYKGRECRIQHDNQAIHNASLFKAKPFIPVNCGAIPGELMESEFFGYVDGAFSGAMKGGRPGRFELASGGTILLDEIGDMPHNMQVKLLRVLQTGEVQRIGDSKVIKVDTRIIASTNVNLPHAISEKRFRQDLYYRLNILPINIPPLRERGATDIQSLADYFLKKHKPIGRFTPSAIEALSCYDWPGNVRELEYIIQRAVHICDREEINPEHLGLPSKKSLPVPPQAGSLDEMAQEMVGSTLDQTNFNMAETAIILGISRATLYRKVKAYKMRKGPA